MGLEIENLARELFLAAEAKAAGGRSWERLCIEERRAWLASAVIAWPDVDAGVRVPADSWMAGVLPVSEVR